MKIVITSGGFDPIHNGHIEYLRKAKELGDFHICILNNDNFLKQKKGYCFFNVNQRYQIMKELRCIDDVIISVDKDLTVCDTIKLIYNKYNNGENEFIFAKGGDRFLHEIPESAICKELNIKIVDGLGEKIESSSNLVNKVKSAREDL